MKVGMKQILEDTRALRKEVGEWSPVDRASLLNAANRARRIASRLTGEEQKIFHEVYSRKLRGL